MSKYVELLPDWTPPQKIVLSLPSGIDDNRYREDIIVDYAYYLKQCKEEVAILYNNTTSASTIQILSNNQIELIKYESSDIWIRDWAPLLVKKGGELLALKFQYKPEYAYHSEKDNLAGRTLNRVFEFEQRDYGLAWEMGNFTTNGKGVVIVTDQVLQQNGMVRDDDLRDYLISTVGCDPNTRIFTLYVNDLFRELWDLILGKPDETICHIDGIIRFIDVSRVVYSNSSVDLTKLSASKFPVNWTPDRIRKYCSVINEINYRVVNLTKRMLYEKVVTKAHPITDIIDRPYDITSNETISDWGDPINYLRSGNKLYLPKYRGMGPISAKYDHLNDITLIDVFSDNLFVDRLCELGGVLNCASWVLYSIPK